jgi:hypothetical protein
MKKLMTVETPMSPTVHGTCTFKIELTGVDR